MSLTRDIHLDPIRRSLTASLVAFATKLGFPARLAAVVVAVNAHRLLTDCA